MRDNKGFSLIEMLVVIAIISVLSGVSVSMINMMSSGNMVKNARTLSSNMSETKQKSMTQNLSYGWYYEAKLTSSGLESNIYKGTNTGATSTSAITLQKCTLTYIDAASASHEINRFTVKYDASTGAVKEFKCYDSAGTEYTQTSGVVEIILTQKSKKGSVLLYLSTGKSEAQ